MVSFVNATMVLSIGETVEECTNSGYVAHGVCVRMNSLLILSFLCVLFRLFMEAPTLALTRMGEDAIVQVHPKGVRYIRSDGRVNEWSAPGSWWCTHYKPLSSPGR